METFGIDHDGENNNCPSQSGRGNIMAPTIMSKWTMYHWSFCTRQALATKLNQFRCLSESRDDEHAVVVKSQWTVADHCRLSLRLPESFIFHTDPQKCPQVCYTLWCPSLFIPHFCVPYKSIVLPPGSRCGQNKVCHNGKCVTALTSFNDPRMWSECRLCTGSGIVIREKNCHSSAQRVCMNDQKFKVVKCPRSASLRKCRFRKLDIREKLCHRKFGENATAYHSEAAPCMSICGIEGKLFSMGSLPNGTPCHFNNSADVCVGGVCESVDCLGQTGGSAVQDVCGICRGNGSTCSDVKIRLPISTVLKNLTSIYQFPRGVKNIMISKVSSYFSLALVKSHEGEKLTSGNGGMFPIIYGTKFIGKDFNNGLSLIYGRGTLLSSQLHVLVKWKSPIHQSGEVFVSYTNSIVLDRIQTV